MQDRFEADLWLSPEPLGSGSYVDNIQNTPSAEANVRLGPGWFFCSFQLGGDYEYLSFSSWRFIGATNKDYYFFLEGSVTVPSITYYVRTDKGCEAVTSPGYSGQGGGIIFAVDLSRLQKPGDLPGQALREAAPEVGKFPLLVYSHGQPGSRYQSAYLMEHLASRGFVVAAIDHTGSLYRDLTQPAYVTSLIDRPLDILFVLGQVPKSLPSADGDTAGLIGYSYGGYSVLGVAGAGIERAGLEQYCQQAGNEGPCFLLPFLAQVEPQRGAQVVRPDPRVKAVFVIAPYGAPWYYGSLPRLKVPLFVAVGEEDDVATYARDGLEVYRRAGSKAKYLLTLEGARHNPFVVCPPEARANPEDFERCWEPVWDKERLFDLARHFAAPFFAHHLKADAQAGQYLEPGLPGFRPRAKVGIRLEHGR